MDTQDCTTGLLRATAASWSRHVVHSISPDTPRMKVMVRSCWHYVILLTCAVSGAWPVLKWACRVVN